MSKDDFQYGKNVGEPAVTVVHELKWRRLLPQDAEHAFLADWTLRPVNRLVRPLKFRRENDRCIACAQRVIYADIVDMRKKLG